MDTVYSGVDEGEVSGNAVQRKYLLYALSSLCVFIASLSLVYAPTAFDIPVARFINKFADKYPLLDAIMYHLNFSNTLAGVLLCTLVSYVWFRTPDLLSRSRILMGALVAFPTGIFSRFLQHRLATHPRPFYDPALQFHPPSLLGALPLSTWNSFPSDHATVMAALAFTVLIARPKLGWFVIPWLILLEVARIFIGAHYPTDVISGAALAAFVMCLVQSPLMLPIGVMIVRLEKTRPALFYAVAFLTLYEIATLFEDIRAMSGGFTFFHLLKPSGMSDLHHV